MQIPRHIFRENDIRGVYGLELDVPIARMIGLALGSELVSGEEVAVGYDMRTSSPALALSLASGLVEAGCKTVIHGLITTPLLYFSTVYPERRTGVMVTASHLPLDNNGFKIARGGIAYTYEQMISKIEMRIVRNDFRRVEWANLGSWNYDAGIINMYISEISSKIRPERRLKLVVDVGSGSCWFARSVIERCGFEARVINDAPSGIEGAPRVDPLRPASLQCLRHVVVEEGADLGIALDPDADRVGLVDDRGRIILPDHIAMLLISSSVRKKKGCKALLYVGLSPSVAEYAKELGATPFDVRSGHSYIQERMVDLHADVACEANGHYYLADDFYGFDDGIFVALRVAEEVSVQGRSLSAIVDSLPGVYAPPTEIHIPVPEQLKDAVVQAVGEYAEEAGYAIKRVIGVRAESGDEWFLIRRSGSEASIVIRYGGASFDVAERARKVVESMLAKAYSKLGIKGEPKIERIPEYNLT
jgi:phosphomannomutase/phosphoglucomutase